MIENIKSETLRCVKKLRKYGRNNNQSTGIKPKTWEDSFLNNADYLMSKYTHSHYL